MRSLGSDRGGDVTSKGNQMDPHVFNFVHMSQNHPHFTLGHLLKLIVGCVLCPALLSAQPNHQRLLDTAVVSNGVLGGYLTASGEEVVRMQYGAALELYRYAEDGTPLWGQRYSVEGAQWNRSIVLSDGAEGAVMLGNASILDAGTALSRVELVHFAIDGQGAVSNAQRLELALDQVLSNDHQPVLQLIRSSDGSMFMVVRSSLPGCSTLFIAKRNSDGSIGFVRSLSDGSNAGSTWGDLGSMACADGAGGLFIAHRDPGAGSTKAGRIGSTGELLWLKRFEDPADYEVSAYDIKASDQGELLILGKMVGEVLPSGGMLKTISAAGSALRLDRYQWDMGRRLYVLADGSMATVKEPWIYRLDGSGQVLWTKAFEDWVIEPHLFLFETTDMRVEHGKLWMQGVLRRILIQFNTQRLLPAFATHPLDSIEGCLWTTATGFGSVSMDISSLTSLPVDSVLFATLDADLQNSQVEVTTALPDVRRPVPFCEQAVGMAEELSGVATLNVFPNPVERGSTLQVSDALPGFYTMSDVQGRILWKYELRGTLQYMQVPITELSAGIRFLRHVPADGSLGSVAKVLVQ